MIKQPDKGTRNANDLFYESEEIRKKMMCWYGCSENLLQCGWDNCTIEPVVYVFRKVGGL